MKALQRVLFLLALVIGSRSFAATITVNLTQDDDKGSLIAGQVTLREAIRYSLPGDTINLPAGTFTLTRMGAGEDQSVLGDLDIWENLTIVGAGTAATIINGNSTDRIIEVRNGSVTISNLTLTNGNATTDAGGAILLNGSLTLNNCTINANTADSGGAIEVESGALTLDHCTLSQNTATEGSGGAIEVLFGTVTLTACTFSGNSADKEDFFLASGGAIYSEGALTATGCTFIDNHADSSKSDVEESGGAILCIADLTVTNSRFDNNSCYRNGGAIAVFDDGTTAGFIVSITGCTFTNNRIGFGGNGGAISNGRFITEQTDAVLMTVTNCTFDNNNGTEPGGWGGAIANSGELLKVINCTMTNNAADEGGGFFHYRGQSQLVNTLIANNTAVTNGPDVSLSPLGNTGDENVLSNHCLVSDNTGFASGKFIDGVDGNICGTALSKLDPHLGPLQDNGGGVLTRALYWDSLAIDAGTTVGAPATDQRGFTRTVDVWRPLSPADATRTGPDIGAFEDQRIIVTNLNNSGAGSLRQAILDCANRGFTFIEFDLGGTVSAVKVIQPTAALPVISTPLAIVGYDVGFSSEIQVRIDGGQAGAAADGLTITSGNAVVWNLYISAFSNGILLSSSRNQILSSSVGIGPGTAAQGNRNNGISIAGGGSNNWVRNCKIANNVNAGVAVPGGAGTGNTIMANSIHHNGGLGIDLGATGPNTNDAGDSDSGPNRLQNAPELSELRYTFDPGFFGIVKVNLNSLPNTLFQVDVYLNTDETDGTIEGEVNAANVSFTTDASGNAESFAHFTPDSTRQYVTAIATNLATGDTSEFCAAVTPLSITAPAAITCTEDIAFPFVSPSLIALVQDGAGSTPIDATIAATHGTVTLATTANLAVTGNGTANVTINGILADINAALNGMQFLGNLNYNGPAALEISAVDAASGGFGPAASATVNITIVPANDAPTDIQLSNNTVPEGHPIGRTIGNLSSIDPDAGLQTFTYSLAQGTGDTGNAAFYIDENLLLAAISFDFEAQSVYSVRVRSTDQGGLSFEKVFTVTVENANEYFLLEATAFVGSAFSYTIFAPGNPEPPVQFALTLPDEIGSLAEIGLSYDDFNKLSGVPTRSGMLTMKVTGSGLEGDLVLTIKPAGSNSNTPQIISRATATPNPVIVETPVEFSVVATDKDGDILSYYWDFADGSSARSRIATHAYDVPGTYDVTVVVSDGKRTTFQHVYVTVVPVKINVTDISKTQIIFDFRNPVKSSLLVAGKVPVAANFTPGGASVNVAFTGSNYDQTFVLNAKGAGGDDRSLLTVGVAIKGAQSSSAKFTLNLRGDRLFEQFKPLGYKNATISRPGADIDLPLLMKVNVESPAGFTIKTNYISIVNRTGKAKLKK